MPKKWNLENFARKRPKNRKREFSREIFFRHFLKDQKIGSYECQKSGKFIVAFGSNGPKRAFWPKTAKKSKTRICPRKFFSPFFKRPKNRFLWQKSGKFIVAFGINGPKRAFLAKNGQKIENENFRQKSETSQI